MPENEHFIGVLHVNGKYHFAEGDTQEEVEHALKPFLEIAQNGFTARTDWEKELRVWRAEEIPLKTIGPDTKKR